MLTLTNDSTQMHCYTKDSEGNYVAANPVLLDFSGYTDINEILGKKDRDLIWCRASQQIMQNDAKVIRSGTACQFIEKPIIKGRPFIRRCYKSPLLGHLGKIIGMVGISMPLSKESLISLSAQQEACLKQLALGNSNKKIALILGLSHKTVEHYLDAVKIKLNCRTRADLIRIAYEKGLVGGNSPI